MSSVWDELNNVSDFDDNILGNLKDELEDAVSSIKDECHNVQTKISQSVERISDIDDTLLAVIALLKTSQAEGADVGNIVDDAINMLTEAQKELY